MKSSLQYSVLSSDTLQPRMIILLLIFIATVASADLQNPHFESPPTNLPVNHTDPFVLLNKSNTIPGWSFEGTVQYVTAGQQISLPGNGHAIRLGQDGKINQTFNADGGFMNYILTFTLAPDGQNCSVNGGVIVSSPDSKSTFSLMQRFGKEIWESYGVYLGSWGDEIQPIDLVFQSQAVETADPESNATCWPIVADLILKGIKQLKQFEDNILLNGGFESGPDFLSNSSEGILLNPEPSHVKSALQQWSVIETVKYIDSNHYFVPEGKAAIEIVSGVSAGVQTAMTLTEGSKYNLEFMLGDANDSCAGDFLVGARAGSVFQNFSVQSNGTGSAKKFSMAFKAQSSPTLISFLSYTTSQTRDGAFCGPVVDGVVLKASYGHKLELQCLLVYFLVQGAILLMMHERAD